MEQFQPGSSELISLLWKNFGATQLMRRDTGNPANRHFLDLNMLNVSITDRVARK